MMLTIGAFMLLGVVLLNFRALNFQNEDILDTNEYTQRAVAIGQAMFEEIEQKPFDASVAAGKWIRKASDFTACGPGWGEVYPNFNDLDDYHRSVFLSPEPGTTPTTAIPRCLWDTWGYRVAVLVHYVSENNPETVSSVYTFYKRVALTITNQFSQDTVRMSYVVAY
jgi:hypothetical protein